MFSAKLAARLRESELHIVITGGGSWLGQASLATLEDAFCAELPARVSVFGSSARRLPLPSGHNIECRKLADILALPPAPYLFLHYAFVTKGHIGEHSLSDYARLNDEIAETVETAARRVGAKGFFLPSSGAVYGPGGQLRQSLEEHPYGFLKLQDERRFARLRDDIGCRLSAVRVFNLGGPYINNLEGYALSSIIMNILRGEPVWLRADRPVFRSYVHITDLTGFALADILAAADPAQQPFDTAGEVVVEVGELARLVADVFGKPDYPVERPAVQGASDRYVGDGERFRERARSLEIELQPLRTQIEDTAADLKRRFFVAGS